MHPIPQSGDLRKKLKERRAALSRSDRVRFSNLILRRLLRMPAVRKARVIGIYLPKGAEVDVRAIEFAVSAKLVVPTLDPIRSGHLWFVPWHSDVATRLNCYGIEEPRHGKPIRLNQIDVLIGPLLGFDDLGKRMGMGGGYYDRTLRAMRSRTSWRRPLYLCVAYEVQRVARLAANPWDVEPSTIITERELV